ncbi:MAG: hypothetical protein R6V12_06180 [Candidatus Hydrogenedentota bacterium]
MNTLMQCKLGGALLLAAITLTPNVASAQWYQNHHNSGNYGQTSQTNWHTAQGIHSQRPGAAIVGGLLQGIGGGLIADNPQENAVAGSILNGLGQGFTVASEPTIWSQGSVQQSNHGYYNHNSGSNRGRRPTGHYGRPRPRHRHRRSPW